MPLHINNPCHENWEAMSPTEQGKFCTACQKEVTDFTTFSLAELQQFLAKEASSCGRFRKSQLEDFNAQLPVFPTPSRVRAWATAAVLTAVVTLPSFGQNQAAAVNSPLVVTLPASAPIHPDQVPASNSPQQKMVTLAGKVYDVEAKEALPFATVWVEGTGIGTTTGLEGDFKLEVPFSEKPLVLIVAYIGYPISKQTIVPNQSREQLFVEMKAGEDMEATMIGLFIVSKKDQRAIKRAARKEARLEKKAARKNK